MTAEGTYVRMGALGVSGRSAHAQAAKQVGVAGLCPQTDTRRSPHCPRCGPGTHRHSRGPGPLASQTGAAALAVPPGHPQGQGPGGPLQAAVHTAQRARLCLKPPLIRGGLRGTGRGTGRAKQNHGRRVRSSGGGETWGAVSPQLMWCCGGRDTDNLEPGASLWSRLG